MGNLYVWAIFLSISFLLNPAWAGNPTFFAQNAPAAAATITYTATSANASTQTIYTYSSLALGTASANRYILVGVGGRSGTVGVTISSVTVGGVSATSVYQTTTGGNASGFFIVALPTGTTGDVVVTFSTACVRAGVGVWAVRNLHSTTPSATVQLAGGPATGTLNVPKNGFAVGLYYGSFGAANNITSAGLTKHFNHYIGAYQNFAGASLAFATAQSPLTVTFTATNGDYQYQNAIAIAFY